MYKGIANLCHHPSFTQLDYMSFETHIVAFDKDLYGEYIEVELIEYLRNEIKFATINEFLEQIRIDLKKMEKICQKGLTMVKSGCIIRSYKIFIHSSG